MLSRGGRCAPESHEPYTIYSMDSIQALKMLVEQQYQEKKKSNVWEDELDEMDARTIRYLLDGSKILWFALEGVPLRSNNIPPHSKMSPVESCLCSGNIMFDDTFTHVVRVNNKSGDFQPDDYRLYWALQAMVACSIPFAETLEVEHLRVKHHYEIKHDVLNECFSSDVETIKAIGGANEAAASFTVEGEAAESSSASRGKPSRLSFTPGGLAFGSRSMFGSPVTIREGAAESPSQVLPGDERVNSGVDGVAQLASRKRRKKLPLDAEEAGTDEKAHAQPASPPKYGPSC
jgi:hypothetical protein